MAFYESVIIIRPELSSAQVDNIISNIDEVLNSQSGEIKKKEYWGLRTLAYKIKKNKKGHYYMINIECNSAAIFELERQMKINEDIIRFLSLKIPEIDSEPSIIAKNRNDKDEVNTDNNRHNKN